jgi:hypothetical protein
MAERKAMIKRDHKLSITRQASPVNISRGTGLLLARPVSPADLVLIRRLAECTWNTPS